MEEIKTQLPENAFRELKKGESYEPLMSPRGAYPEVTGWSVTWGVLMAMLFSAAAAYLGLKVGQVFEAAIPIAIIAVGVSTAAKRSKALGENVIIQSIGACSGAVVAGAIFTLPAIYILQAKYPEMSASFMQVFMASALGGFLGILFLIPFRKYFVSDMHGKYPFPEATATTQVLVTGIKREAPLSPPEGDTSASARETKEAHSGAVGGAGTLLLAGLVGGLYDFVVSTFGWWNETVTTRMVGWGELLAEKAKLVMKVNTSAAVLGLGYIIGLKYALYICLGSVAVWWLIVPLLSLLFHDQVLAVGGAAVTQTVGEMSPEVIFKTYARSIGIGGIAMAGIIGIVKSWPVIKSAVKRLTPTPNPSPREGGEYSSSAKKADSETNQSPLPWGGEGGGLRTQLDLSFRFIAIAAGVALLATFVFFWLGVMDNLLFAVVGIVLVAFIAFLFTTVAANAIAIVGSNPVSGMTLMTLILASVMMAAVGLSGAKGMLAALIMGGVVCTALSMAGCFVTDLKIGYWLGTTPKKQESWKFLGTLVSAATVGGVMMLLNETYGFDPDVEGHLVAPQANAMAAVIEPVMNGEGAPWLLYGIGALIALIINFCGMPALAVALGMFIPLELNLPLLVGGAINWYITTRTKDTEVNKARGEKGTLIASGFIAGGALMGVVSALMRFGGLNFVSSEWMQNPLSELAALVAYILLIVYFIYATRTTKG